jgi:hypothetical protein
MAHCTYLLYFGLFCSANVAFSLSKCFSPLIFLNFQINRIYRTTYSIDHTSVYKLTADGTNIPMSFNNNTITVPYTANFNIDLYIDTNRYSTYYNKRYYQLSDQQIKDEFNQLITTL